MFGFGKTPSPPLSHKDNERANTIVLKALDLAREMSELSEEVREKAIILFLNQVPHEVKAKLKATVKSLGVKTFLGL